LQYYTIFYGNNAVCVVLYTPVERIPPQQDPSHRTGVGVVCGCEYIIIIIIVIIRAHRTQTYNASYSVQMSKYIERSTIILLLLQYNIYVHGTPRVYRRRGVLTYTRVCTELSRFASNI